jgi:hypothetical protein
MEHGLLEFWPVLAVGGAGLLAWGELRQKVKRVSEEVDSKVNKDTFQQVDTRMERIERQVDRLVDTLVERN